MIFHLHLSCCFANVQRYLQKYFSIHIGKNARGSDVNLDNYEDLFYSPIDRNSSLNSTMMDKVIPKLFHSPQSTLSSMVKMDIEYIRDKNVNFTKSNKVNIRFFLSTFTNFYKG